MWMYEGPRMREYVTLGFMLSTVILGIVLFTVLRAPPGPIILSAWLEHNRTAEKRDVGTYQLVPGQKFCPWVDTTIGWATCLLIIPVEE